MTISSKLDGILNEAAGNRPADKSDGDTVPQKITDDSTAVAGKKVTKDEGHAPDQNGTLPHKKGTEVSDPAGEVSKCDGTEVQGNTNANDGLGESVAENIKAKLVESVTFKVDLSALKNLCESQDLGEEFSTAAAEIFEAAVNDVVADKLGEICEAAGSIVESTIELYANKLEEDIDAYLDHVVTEWAEDNKLAIVQAGRVELAESFMNSMKGLLEDHYVELPSDKVDLYESAVEVGEELVESLAEAEAKIAELQESLALAEKRVVVESFVSGMTSTKAEKIRSLAESIQFDEAESFTQKLTVLSENFVAVGKKESTLVEDTIEVQTEQLNESVQPAVAPDVQAAVKALGTYVRR